MPYPAEPGAQSNAEACFARHFPSLKGASTAEIREAQAYARAAVNSVRREQLRNNAMQAWLAEHQLVLPLAISESE